MEQHLYAHYCFAGLKFSSTCNRHNFYCCFVVLQCLVDGADEYLQLLDVASNAMRALCNMPEEFPHES